MNIHVDNFEETCRKIGLVKLFLSLVFRKVYYEGIDKKKDAPRLTLRDTVGIIKVWW
jgi:hypothetical protein